MNGLLLFNKPILWTSHDAVDFIRRRIGQRRVGHAGTLDPLATGLLLILAGTATKRSEELSGLEKEYRGSLCLGMSTDTLDMEGRVVAQAPYGHVTQDAALSVFRQMEGSIPQTPPAFSARHQAGKRLYAYARAGIAVETAARTVQIQEFKIENFMPPEIYFSVVCSKGTYVRSLCAEAGRKLGCGATLSSLVRTRIGGHLLKNALGGADAMHISASDLERKLIRI